MTVKLIAVFFKCCKMDYSIILLWKCYCSLFYSAITNIYYIKYCYLGLNVCKHIRTERVGSELATDEMNLVFCDSEALNPDQWVKLKMKKSFPCWRAWAEQAAGHVTVVMYLLYVGHVIPSGGLLGNNLKDFWGYNSAC